MKHAPALRTLIVGLVSMSSLAFAQAQSQAQGQVVAANAVAVPSVDVFTHMPLPERRSAISGANKEAVEALYKATPIDVLLATAKRNALALGSYSSTVYKTERVDGELIDTQTIDTYVREKPHAVRMTYVDGPGKGRKVCFNSANPDHGHEIRVREAGFAGIVGAIWVDIDSSLTRKESNYAVTAMGLGPMLAIVTRQIGEAKADDYQRYDDGMGDFNRYFVRFEPKKKGLVALKLGFDVESGVPTFVEVRDEAGLRERHDWRNVKQRELAKDYFTPESAGL